MWGVEVKDEEVPGRRGSCPGSCGMAWAGQEGRPERLGEVWAGGGGDTFSLNYPGAPQSLEGESLMQMSRPSVLTGLGRCRSRGLSLLMTPSLALCGRPCLLPSPEDQHLDRPRLGLRGLLGPRQHQLPRILPLRPAPGGPEALSGPPGPLGCPMGDGFPHHIIAQPWSAKPWWQPAFMSVVSSCL